MIPDAPWIRDAEMYGYPDDDPVHCPICGEECDTIFSDKYGNVFACENCLYKQDAWDWRDEQPKGGE